MIALVKLSRLRETKQDSGRCHAVSRKQGIISLLKMIKQYNINFFLIDEHNSLKKFEIPKSLGFHRQEKRESFRKTTTFDPAKASVRVWLSAECFINTLVFRTRIS